MKPAVAIGQLLVRGELQVQDAAVTRGGCRVETSSCEIDATLETRWQKLSAALAQDHEWIA